MTIGINPGFYLYDTYMQETEGEDELVKGKGIEKINGLRTPPYTVKFGLYIPPYNTDMYGGKSSNIA